MNLFPSTSDIVRILFCFAFNFAKIEGKTVSFLL